MKPNQPSLVLFFGTIILTIIFEIFFQNRLPIIYLKSMAVPLMFIYFLISNKYKITWFQAVIFICCFVGDVVIVLNPAYSSLGSMYCFMAVYMLLLVHVLKNFKRVRVRKIDVVPILIVVSFVVFLLFSILKMTINDTQTDMFLLYVVYGIVLCTMSCVCFINHIIRPTAAHLFITLTAICFILSDMFFVFNEFYHDLLIFRIIRNSTQSLAYYFMVRYFLLKKKEVKSDDLNHN
ncbi:lysoplasmalogenase family protein [Flavobacterium sp. TAB 87]|uniref:lysoplasmalogenase family protein n=1 Tax=Flavobacterium sp. TAB 87 TaxID=1729581 RepID=UPI00076DB076|nr:lysoplasmalogenase family protein [Flavobacterium sp. TAB 87]KVV15841.1 YhhN-like protein [Flavobacterium sp. TAB 87]